MGWSDFYRAEGGVWAYGWGVVKRFKDWRGPVRGGVWVACAWVAAMWALGVGRGAERGRVGPASESSSGASAAPFFRVMTYNVENYLVTPTASRSVKAMDSRRKVQEVILAVKPDVLALQEIGETNSLFELQGRLAAAGWTMPHWEHVRGYDTNIFVAVLSRFPIVRREPHSQLSYLLDGRRYRLSRGVAEVEVEVRPGYRFTLLTTHLKSKRPMAMADEAEVREREAERLREVIDGVLRRQAGMNVLVCGDLNDHKDSRAVRTVVGRGATGLIDTRPSEWAGVSGDFSRGPGRTPEGRSLRRVTWTHFYGQEDAYSRVDYILLSRGMAREWRADESYVVAMPEWGQASDHRAVVAVFRAANE